jgi:hypothetical protein
MKFPRRQFLHLAAGAVALPVVSRIAWAQARGGSDIFARLIGQWLSERLGLGSAAGHSDGQRIRAGLRGEYLVGRRRAEEYAR